MNLCILLVLASFSLTWSLPAPKEQEQDELHQDQVAVQQNLSQQEQFQQEQFQQELSQQDVSNTDSKARLIDDVNLGSEHADEGARKARFLWGLWGRPWYGYNHYYPSYSYDYYRPSWGYNYHSYWW